MKKIFAAIFAAVMVISFLPVVNVSAGYLGITTTALPDATVGSTYSYQLQAEGNNTPFTWSTLSTTYPSGCCVLGLNPGTGLFNTQSSNYVVNPAGTYSWTFQVTDSLGNTAIKTLSLTIKPATIIVSNPYTGNNLTVGSTAEFSWSKSGSFNGPDTYYYVYLKNNPAQILGSSSYPGTYSALAFRVSSLSYPVYSFVVPNVSAGQYYLEINYANASGVPLASDTSDPFTIGTAGSFQITTPTLPTATAGAPYYAEIGYAYSGNLALIATWTGLPNGITTTSGSDTTWGIINGALPKLMGTPTQAGTYQVTLNMTDKGALNISKTFTLTVNPGNNLLISTQSLPTATVNQYYLGRVKFSYNGSYGPNVIVSNLPPGVSVLNSTPGYTNTIFVVTSKDTDGSYFVDLVGTPTQAGSYSIKFNFFDTTHSFDIYQSYPVTVQQSGMPSSASFVSGSLPSGTVGQAYYGSIEVSSDGSFSPNIDVSNLPAGLYVTNASAGWPNAIYGTGTKNFSGNYHVDIGGTPTQAGNLSVLVKVFNTTHTLDISKNYNLIINSSNSNIAVPVMPTHANNTNILGSDGTVYRIQNGYRYPYTSAGAFLSYGFNSFPEVYTANSADMQLPIANYTPSGATNVTTYFIPPRNGSLINDHGTVYLITNGLRAGFSTQAAFLGLGYDFNNAAPGDTSFMVSLPVINSYAIAHPDGTLINDNGTIYLVKAGNKLGFPNMQVFNSWGFKLNEVTPANSYDKVLPLSSVLSTRMDNQLNP